MSAVGFIIKITFKKNEQHDFNRPSVGNRFDDNESVGACQQKTRVGGNRRNNPKPKFSMAMGFYDFIHGRHNGRAQQRLEFQFAVAHHRPGMADHNKGRVYSYVSGLRRFVLQKMQQKQRIPCRRFRRSHHRLVFALRRIHILRIHRYFAREI